MRGSSENNCFHLYPMPKGLYVILSLIQKKLQKLKTRKGQEKPVFFVVANFLLKKDKQVHHQD